MQYMNSQFGMPQYSVPNTGYSQAYSNTVSTEFYQIRPDDQIICISLEDYLAKKGYSPSNVRPEEWVRIYESARDIFYSDIVQRLTRVIAYINYASVNDDRAEGLRNGLSHHMRNPYFINLMLRQLQQENNLVANGFVGAFLCKAAQQYMNEMRKKDEEETPVTTVTSKPKVGRPSTKDKDEPEVKTSTPPKKSNVDENVIASMYNAAMTLLHGKYEYVRSCCVGIEQGDALAIAAFLAMNNELTLKEIIDSNLPLTAELLQNDQNIGSDPGNLIAAALHLQKSDYAKLSVNQTKFIDSLTKWVYSRLEGLEPSACLQYLVGVYHSIAPGDTIKSNLIQLKDCGTQYPQLIQVVRAMKLN